jgi:hypothetical protein
MYVERQKKEEQNEKENRKKEIAEVRPPVNGRYRNHHSSLFVSMLVQLLSWKQAFALELGH